MMPPAARAPRRARAAVLFTGLAVLAGAGLGSAATRHDPPLLVPWSRIGDLRLGEPRALVEREYGRPGKDETYRLHGTRVYVSYRDGRLNDIDFTSRYYRTKAGFGIGSRIPLGPCHRTATSRCEHRWRGFLWNPTLRESPCGCWVKVGSGAESLPPTGANFLKPWTIIDTGFTGRATAIELSLKYVD